MFRRTHLLLILLLLLGLVACGTPDQVDDAQDSADIEVVDQTDADAAPQEDYAEEDYVEPTPTIEVTPTPAAPTLHASPSKDVYAIGDAAQINDLLVQVSDVKLAGETELGKPNEGNQFLLVSVTVENTGDQPHDVSTLLHMRVLDADGKEIGQDPAASLDFIDLNGSIDGHSSATGTVGYQVPADAQALQWAFLTTEPDATAGLKETGRVLFSIVP